MTHSKMHSIFPQTQNKKRKNLKSEKEKLTKLLLLFPWRDYQNKKMYFIFSFLVTTETLKVYLPPHHQFISSLHTARLYGQAPHTCTPWHCCFANSSHDCLYCSKSLCLMEWKDIQRTPALIWQYDYIAWFSIERNWTVKGLKREVFLQV